MGLDQFAYMIKPREILSVKVGTAKVVIEEHPENKEPLHQWRKHPNLQGWMEALYRSRGGEESFNCKPVQLTAEDLDRLEADIKEGRLPDTGGFFFGTSDGNEKIDDLLFIKKARKAIKNGKLVFYDSWW